MLTLWPQGMLLFQQPVGKHEVGIKRAPGAKHTARHLALHQGKTQAADLLQFQVLLTQQLKSWYT